MENFAKAAANAKGAAQKATDTRDKAVKVLKEWTGEFRKVAKRTLRGRPDLLAALELKSEDGFEYGNQR